MKKKVNIGIFITIILMTQSSLALKFSMLNDGNYDYGKEECSDWKDVSTHEWIPKSTDVDINKEIVQKKETRYISDCTLHHVHSSNSSTPNLITIEKYQKEKNSFETRTIKGERLSVSIQDKEINKPQQNTDKIEYINVLLNGSPENDKPYTISYKTIPMTAKEYDNTQSGVGASGDVRMNIYWDKINADIDSWVQDPCGNWISYKKKEAICKGKRGVLDVDDTSGGKGENVTFPQGAASGMYTFCVHDYSNKNSFIKQGYVKVGNQKFSFNGQATHGSSSSCAKGILLKKIYYNANEKYEKYNYEKSNGEITIPKGAKEIKIPVTIFGSNAPSGKFKIEIEAKTNNIKTVDSTAIITIK